MSDPVTQAEIEDVLSSIRRLVSEDGRSTPRPVPVQSAPKVSTRLVLTPALRVSASEDLASAPDSDTAVRDTFNGTEHDTKNEDTPFERVSVSAEASVDGDASHDNAALANEAHSWDRGQTDGMLADVAEIISLPPSSHGAHQDATDQENEALVEQACDSQFDVEANGAAPTKTDALSDVAADVSEASPWQDPDATLFQAAATSGHDLTGDATDVAAASDGAGVQDAGGLSLTAALSSTQSSSEPLAPDSVTPAEAFSTSHAATEQNVSDAAVVSDQDAGASARVSAVVQKIAELEAKVARSEEQWEPDGLSRDPYAGTNIETLEWKDHLEDEVDTQDRPGSGADKDGSVEVGVAAPADPVAEAAPEPEVVKAEDEAERLVKEAATREALEQIEGLAGDESYLDEDSLRELVADIVRSELQGALGERITRNVRKLVRREIHRALAAQDLI